MLLPTLIEFFERELDTLSKEISAYTQETDLWVLEGTISNTAGNLTLHLIGNLNHFIGAVLGNTGYVRQRELEFSSKTSREELLKGITVVKKVVSDTLQKLSPEQLAQDFPLDKHGKIVSTNYMLVHLLTHLNYHLGQINYHRRLIHGRE